MSRVMEQRWAEIARWGVRLMLALVFLSAGGFKLLGHPMMVENFARLGLGQWLRYLSGVAEVAGATGVLLPAITPFARVVLVCLLFGAIATHLSIFGSAAWPSLVLLTAAMAVACRAQLAALIDDVGEEGH
jgi:uncharacterized membrane protein YphA (DoxX/SURF4 family)